MKKFFEWIGAGIAIIFALGFNLIFIVAAIGMTVFFWWIGFSFLKGCYLGIVVVDFNDSKKTQFSTRD